jgi:hypothetical protein
MLSDVTERGRAGAGAWGAPGHVRPGRLAGRTAHVTSDPPGTAELVGHGAGSVSSISRQGMNPGTRVLAPTKPAYVALVPSGRSGPLRTVGRRIAKAGRFGRARSIARRLTWGNMQYRRRFDEGAKQP